MSIKPANLQPLHSSLLEKEPELFDLIKKYVMAYPEMIRVLKTEMEEKNWDDFNQYLHDLKSTGGNYGFMCITELAVQIKTHLDENNQQAILPLLDELDALQHRMLLAVNDKAE